MHGILKNDRVSGKVIQPEKEEFTGNLSDDVPSGWWGQWEGLSTLGEVEGVKGEETWSHLV